MAKGTVHDSLFLGMHLGQTKQEFFDKCWKLNKNEIVTNSANNNFVEYILSGPKGNHQNRPITMLFYGIFNKENTMTGMDLKFYYEAWSLWNESTHSDRLFQVVRDTLKSWYPGNDFIKVPLKNNQKELFVKVDGNRRITIKPLNDPKEVKVQIDDLRYLLDE